MQGHCLCGAVKFTANEAKDIGVCHCGFCRRWGGGPLLAVHCGSGVAFDGGDNITVFASSEWAERGFCKRCGTHLYYKLLPTGEYFVPAGAFDSDDFRIATQIYVDRKPDYYSLANQTPMLTEQQVLDQFAASGGSSKD